MTPHWIDIPIGCSVRDLTKGLRGLANQLERPPGLYLYSLSVQQIEDRAVTRITFGLDTAEEIERRASATTRMPEVPAPPADPLDRPIDQEV